MNYLRFIICVRVFIVILSLLNFTKVAVFEEITIFEIMLIVFHIVLLIVFIIVVLTKGNYFSQRPFFIL